MIHVRASASTNDIDEATLHFSLVGLETIKKLDQLLDRSLNCAPEFGADWFELSDKVKEFILKEEAQST